MINQNMINNFNNINNLMIPNQNNMFSNDKQKILDLINQNIQTTNLIKNLVENSNFGNQNKEENGFWKNFYNIDFFPGYSNNRINIIFCNSSGVNINMVAPLEVKRKDLLKFFHIKLQIYGQYILKINIDKIDQYFFLYRGSLIQLNEQKTISQLGMANSVETIIFNSRNNIIGGKGNI